MRSFTIHDAPGIPGRENIDLGRTLMLARSCAALATATLLALCWSGCSSSNAGLPPDGQDLLKLDTPPKGQGVHMTTTAFTIPPGTEIQSCFFFKVSDLAAAAGFDPTQPLNVHRVQILQTDGSHHMNLFRVRT